jgi:predicted signal transduction protein with EAL and GGDEF domain
VLEDSAGRIWAGTRYSGAYLVDPALMEIKGQKVEIGASVGVAVSPRHGRTAEDLYQHADQALYDAKRAGKGVWRWYQGTKLTNARATTQRQDRK